MVGKKTKRCSIVIASYRPGEERLKFCEKTFRTIHDTGLDRDEYELIVVDNGGIGSDFLRKQDIDVLIVNSRNWGQAFALNQAVRVAKSPVIAMMDDDLSFDKGWLKKGLELLNGRNKKIISLRSIGKEKKYTIGETDDGYKLLCKVGGCWIFPRDMVDEIGYFSPHVYSFGGNYTRNLMRSGWKFLLSDKQYIHHLGEKKPVRNRSPKSWVEWYKETFDNDKEPIASITVVTFCPTRNRERLIDRSFSEIRNTGIDDYEIIVVNNGGIQQEQIDELSPDIEVVMKENVGNHSGVNYGWKLSRSNNLIWMDDDIHYENGWLKRGLELLNKYPQHIISLRSKDNFYCGKKHIEGMVDNYLLTRQAGGCWIMRKRLYEECGDVPYNPWRGQGIYARILTRKGHYFLISDKSYISHIGGKDSIIPKNTDRWKENYTKTTPQFQK